MKKENELVTKVGKQRAQSIWESVLFELGCRPDGVGNRPCDNGLLCTKCHQEWVGEIYVSRLKIVAEGGDKQ